MAKKQLIRQLTIDGMQVEDAKEDIFLTVSKLDVRRASKKENRTCAVAKACVRSLHAEARVHLGRIYLRDGNGQWLRFVTPQNLRTEIIAFDRGGEFTPGIYKLTAPTPKEKKRYPLTTGHKSGASKVAVTKRGAKGRTKVRVYNVTRDVRPNARTGNGWVDL